MTILSETRDEYRARRFGFFRRRAREKKIKRSAHLFSRSLSPIRAAGSPSRVRPISQAWSPDVRVAAETLDVITRRHVLLCFVRAVFRARALETPLTLKTHVPENIVATSPRQTDVVLFQSPTRAPRLPGRERTTPPAGGRGAACGCVWLERDGGSAEPRSARGRDG